MKNVSFNQQIFASIVFSFVCFTLIGAQFVPKQCNYNNIANGREILHNNAISLENQTNSKVAIGQDNLNQVGDILYGSFWPCRKLIGINLNTNEIIVYLNARSSDVRYNRDERLLYFTDRHINGANLNAINETGELAWVNHVTNNTRQYIRIFVNQQGQDFASTSLYGFRPINPQTGNLGEPIPVPDTLPGHFYGGYFWNVYSGRLEAYSVENTNEIAWASNYQGLPWYKHQIWADDDIIILRLNDTIQALTRTEGDFLWDYDDTEVISNVNIVDGHVYALDMNADLLKFDIETGEITGRVVFAPPEEDARDTRPNSGVMGSSEIAINANFATIYFGDTGILSTYRLSD